MNFDAAPAGPFLFISGGSRSGKSAFALQLAEQLMAQAGRSGERPSPPSGNGLFVATARIEDEETRRRVKRHREERGDNWRVHEMPAGGAGTLHHDLHRLASRVGVVLLDCLTLWVSAWMEEYGNDDLFAPACAELFSALQALPCPVIVVSNEVGLGLVPSTREGRRFRDLAGLSNQMAAARADAVAFMVSGIPLRIKGSLDISPQG